MTTHKRGRKSWGALLAVAALRDGVALRQPISRKGPSISVLRREEGGMAQKQIILLTSFVSVTVTRGQKFQAFCRHHFWMVPKRIVFFSPGCECDSATCSTYGVVRSGRLSPVVNGVVTGNKGGGKIPMAPMCWAQMLSKIQPQT